MTLPQHNFPVFWLSYPEKQNKTQKVHHFNWTNNLKMARVCKMEAYIMVGRISVCQTLNHPSSVNSQQYAAPIKASWDAKFCFWVEGTSLQLLKRKSKSYFHRSKEKRHGKNIKEKKRNPFNKTTKLNNKRCDVITLRSVIISLTQDPNCNWYWKENEGGKKPIL